MTIMGSERQNGYEVFLSFMGEDTRRGFTDYLYELMVDAGISVFKDNVNLPFGEEIGKSLSKAIEMSKIGMPILSKNYAASRWCLDELVCMLECMNTKNQTVLPIFYDVTPTQVRHQTESYATAFSDHANKYDEETREKWRKALEEVTSLKGLELEKETGGHEGQLTKKILGKVLVELKKTHLRITDEFVGIDDQEKDVKDLLAIDAKDVSKVVGLWGMGGIGKTTLAKFIYNQISDKFESCSFLSDIRGKSLEQNGLARLQTRLVSDLSKHEHRDFSNVDEGLNMLEYMFHEKKVLILLDDVDAIDQLEALAATVNWFGPGSRTIVTTRNRSIMDDLLGLSNDNDIAQECWWACYEVKEMNKEKALQLFCKHAFRQDSPEEKLSDLSHAIVETTGGLPLALEIIGSSLSRKRKSVIWEETLEKLRKVPEWKVQQRLKISYDVLEDDKKHMFIDVACLFIGVDLDFAMYLWKDRRFCAETGKDALLEMSLIKIVDNKIWMHDQLRDLGREIVRQENKERGKRSILWQADEARAAIANMMYGSSSEVEVLHLRNDSNQDYWITSEKLSNYSNVWFLKLHHVNLTGDFRHVNLSELRWLTWQCSSKDCPPTNINLEKLLFLHLSFGYNNIGDDWELIWSSFQSSTELKVLDLNSCQGLTFLDVSMFIKLERLVLQGCQRLKAISVRKLKLLRILECTDCKKLQEIEGLHQLEALQELDLSQCRAIEKLPSLSMLKFLRTLKFNNCEMLQEIEGLNQLEALQNLGLIDCSSIERLPNLSKLKSLMELNCCGCRKLREIEGLDQLEALRGLNLATCKAIEKLPSLSKLRSLNYMSCLNCYILPEIEGLDQLEALQELYLAGCKIIELLPNISKLKSLKTLNCAACPKLQEIEGLDQLEALEWLTLSGCIKIEKLPSLSKLRSLRFLMLFNCCKLREIEGLDQLEALEVLNLSGCKKIEKLPSLSKLKSLKVLNCEFCRKLQEIEGLDQLEALEKLNLSSCEKIKKLPSLSKLKSLKMLDCGSCSELQEIEGLGQLEDLVELNLYGCIKIEKLPSLSKLKFLKVLKCEFCWELQEIEGLDQLEALEKLNLSSCVNIKKLPNLSNLKSLKKLDCDSCSDLQEIEGLDQLEKLVELNLHECDNIEKLPCLSKLKSLKVLNCKFCRKLQEIEGLDQLEALEDLNLSSCKKIKKLPSLSNLKSLKKLDCGLCLELQEIEGLDQLEELVELNLSRCRAIEKLPSLSKLKSLKVLNCQLCSKLQEIEGLDQLDSLQELILDGSGVTLNAGMMRLT